MSEDRRRREEAAAMQRVVDDVADQSVRIFLGTIEIAHWPPNTRWNLLERREGARVLGHALEVWSWSLTRGRMVKAKTYEPGEWTTIGRVSHDVQLAPHLALSRHGAKPEHVADYLRRRGAP